MTIPPVSTTPPTAPVAQTTQQPRPAGRDSDGDNDGSTAKVKPTNPGLGKVADHSA